ncbi:hypothetical protein [Altererythrobacter sp. TH136]|uniref:hypothetical protein n=1 Tax=Altererythrobacter sp. TH136 TaxID=2067415 RepID=UPI0011642DCE|nr:hypothetical protein [Altererythrobacter sp. TH136]QDM39894.1 hypothetical protein C0V74_01640 [Altererythrobacter sp. TH136]
MTDQLERNFREDRRVRDAARALVDADLANLRANYAARGLSDRIKHHLTEGAADVLDEAVAVTEDNKGAVAALVVAIVLWFARHPIIDLLTDSEPTPEHEPTQSR